MNRQFFPKIAEQTIYHFHYLLNSLFFTKNTPTNQMVSHLHYHQTKQAVFSLKERNKLFIFHFFAEQSIFLKKTIAPPPPPPNQMVGYYNTTFKPK